jgi:MFS family permease
MSQTERPSTAAEPRYDLQLHLGVLLFALLVQADAALIRVATSYRVLELGLPVVWLGVISCAFALLPLVAAIQVGRFIDRGNDALAAWIGAAMCGVSSIAIGVAPSSPYLLTELTAIYGLGYMFLMISLQVLCLRSAVHEIREQSFGNFMAANALGQGLGPLLVAWLGGDATVPDTAPIFQCGMVLGVIMIFSAFVLRPAPAARLAARDSGQTPIRELARIPGLLALILASVMTVTAQDLVVIYLPLLGTERGIAAANIGAILTVRSVASLVSRLLYARLVRETGHWQLMMTTMLASAASFVLLALPLPLWMMFLSSAIMGFGLGIATTLSITMVVDIAPLESRATAMTLRISGNRLGQILLPLIASLVAAAAGAWGILAMVALTLGASSAAVFQASPYNQPLRRK